MLKELIKLLALLAVAFMLAHWLTAGHDDILEGPPECLDGTHCTTSQDK